MSFDKYLQYQIRSCGIVNTVIEMKRFYAIQPAFYEVLKKHKHILHELLSYPNIQKDKIFIQIPQEDMLQSCVSYFQEDIQVKDNVLFYRHYLKSQVFFMEFQDCFVQMADLENPFFELLKRKYRYFLIEDI